jgi:hypothetical protein
VEVGEGEAEALADAEAEPDGLGDGEAVGSSSVTPTVFSAPLGRFPDFANEQMLRTV